MTDTEQTEQTEPEKTDEKPKKDEYLANKHGYVDLDKIEDPELRQQVEDRLKGLYRDQKETKSALIEIQSMYANMEKKLGDYEKAQKQSKADSDLEKTRKALVEANAKGDYERAAQLTERLAELKAPKAEPAKPQQDPNALSPKDERALVAWQSEMTNDGRIARPWAHPQSPKYQDTMQALTEMWEAYRHQGMNTVLEKVDAMMAPKKKETKASPVSEGDTTPTKRTSKAPKLTPTQMRVARKLYPQEKDPVAAYTKALEKYGGESAQTS